MTTFEVNDMTCGHCVSTITKAVKIVDQSAQVQIDLATHRVSIDAAQTTAAELGDAIRRAGFTPVTVDACVERGASKSAPSRGGCCCG
ncbi:MAG: heavy-metal-associated domain-containing protein [Burkholderiales bacterium]